MRSGLSPDLYAKRVDRHGYLGSAEAAIAGVRDVPNDQGGKVKVSWRTDAGVDGIAIASKWGGGGHPRASGATFRGTIQEAERVVLAETIGFVK